MLNKCYVQNTVAAAAKSLQSCPTLCDPTDVSPPGSTVPGILQARTLEWVAISFSNAWKWRVKVRSLSCVRLFATPWTAAHEAPLSMGFHRQEYWSGLPSPSPNTLLGTVKYKKMSKSSMKIIILRSPGDKAMDIGLLDSFWRLGQAGGRQEQSRWGCRKK